MDPSSARPLLLPTPSTAFRLPPRPKPFPAAGTLAARSADFSNAQRAYAFVPRLLQSVSQISSRRVLILLFLCSLLQPSARPADASRPAASPVTASPATAARAGRRPRGPPYSIQKCPQSPSTRPSCFEYRHPTRAPSPPKRNPPISLCQFHLAPRRRFRSARASSLQRLAGAPLLQ